MSNPLLNNTEPRQDEIKDKYDLALAVYGVLLPDAPDREAAQDNLLDAGYIIERFIADRERQAYKQGCIDGGITTLTNPKNEGEK